MREGQSRTWFLKNCQNLHTCRFLIRVHTPFTKLNHKLVSVRSVEVAFIWTPIWYKIRLSYCFHPAHRYASDESVFVFTKDRLATSGFLSINATEQRKPFLVSTSLYKKTPTTRYDAIAEETRVNRGQLENILTNSHLPLFTCFNTTFLPVKQLKIHYSD